MKSAISSIAVLLLLTSLTVFGQARIDAVPGTSIEFGEFIQGQKAQKVVQLKNIGMDTLRIGEVKAACGCTATLLSKKNLGPGEMSDLSITFDTHAYTGRVTKQVYIASNDSANPKLTISFTANITPVLMISPQYFAFEKATMDTTMYRTINIKNGLQKESVKITSVHSDSSAIKLTLLKNELMPGEQTQLQAEFHPTKPGSLQGDVELTTDHPNLPVLKIHYYSWVTKKP